MIDDEKTPQPPGSMEDESLSLRHMAANPYTYDGQMERISLEATMSHEPTRRGRLLRVYLILFLGFSVASVVVAMIFQMINHS